MIYIDYKTCSHWNKITHPLLGVDWSKLLFSKTLPDSIGIETIMECAYCGAEWDDNGQEWRAPLFARPLQDNKRLDKYLKSIE